MNSLSNALHCGKLAARRVGNVRCFSSRRSRNAAMQQKQDDLLSRLGAEVDSNAAAEMNESPDIIHKKEISETERIAKTIHLQKQRTELFLEAGYMTRSLYRSCLRNINLIRNGSDKDIKDFETREEREKSDRSSATFSFEPSVDRENELSSRALYYLAFLKESFNQEVDCLAAEPWKEDNVIRFIHLMRQGEERRKWVLNDYGFDDPFRDKWDEDLFVKWEEQVQKLIHETYELKDWRFQKDFTNVDEDDDGDIEWNDNNGN